MVAKRRFGTRILVCLALFVPAQRLLAVFAITNGGFDAQGPEVNNSGTVTPTGWFDASNAVNSFSDNILNVQRGVNGAISNLGGAGIGMWDANGFALGRDAPFGNDGTLETAYLYQKIGDYAGDSTAAVTGSVFNRTNGNRVGNFNVAFYWTTDGAFTPAIGTDVAGQASLIGVQQLFSQGVTAEVLDDIELTIATGTVAQSAAWTHSVSLTGLGIPNGADIWLRLGDAGNPDGLLFDEPIIDNIRLDGCGLGDANCDGVADGTDLTAIRNNFRKSTGVTRAMGDVDGSGDVDSLDYLQWRRAAGGGSAAISGGVPEPATGILGGSAIIALFLSRRFRSAKRVS